MRGTLVAAVAITLAGLLLSSPLSPTGDIAAAETADGCPGKLGGLRLSSSTFDDENANKRELACLYTSKDFAKNAVVKVAWLTQAASPAWLSDLEATYCLRTDEEYVGPGQHGDRTRWGFVFPRAGELYILASYLATEKGPSVAQITELGRELVAGHAGLAATCPGTEEAGSSIAEAPSGTADTPATDVDEVVADPGVTGRTITLSGRPDEALPEVGTTIDLPEDDQHQLVIGGPDGEVIREEFIGERATISGYGPLVTDADGNWSVLVTVVVATTHEPSPVPGTGPSHAPTAAPTPSASASPAPAPTPSTNEPGPVTSTAPPPIPEPANETPAMAATEIPGPSASPTEVPPPELVGVPPGLVGLVAGLPPEAAGAVRDIADVMAGIHDQLDDPLVNEVTEEIPATLIESLRALAPDLVKEVWLTEGSIVVSTTSRTIGSILVTPERGQDGLITVTLDRLRFLESHPIVQVLVAALNGPMAERGRLRQISVTPEGITLTVVRSTQGSAPE